MNTLKKSDVWFLQAALLLLSACSSDGGTGDNTDPALGTGAPTTGTAGTAPGTEGATAGAAGVTGTSTGMMMGTNAGAGALAGAGGTAAAPGPAESDPVDAGVEPNPAADASAETDPEPMAQTGTLPVPDSLDGPGPYEVLDEPDTGPGNQFRLFAPQPLGEDGLKHPVVAWSPGAGAFPEAYLTLLTRLASQGFVVLSYNTTADGSNLVDAIDWMIAENERDGSVLFGKLDTDKIAAGGHSAGSLATYQMADDSRLTTTLHMSGGSFTPQADVPRLRAPALMVCGGAGGDGLVTGDLANPMCAADFELATVPVFYAVVDGAGHTALNDDGPTLGFGTPADDPGKLLFIKATVGWLRWQLAGDESLKKMFVGADCDLCAAGSGYTVLQKNL